MTVNEAWTDFMVNATMGTARNNRGERYKASVLRNYQSAVTAHFMPRLHRNKMSELTRGTVQVAVDALVQDGVGAGPIRNGVTGLRAMWRFLEQREQVTGPSPFSRLQLPAVGKRAVTTLGPDEVFAYLSALYPLELRRIWAAAFYAGLRVGELQALRYSDIDPEARTIRVSRSYDEVSKTFGTTKTGRERTVHYPAVLALSFPIPFGLLAAGWGDYRGAEQDLALGPDGYPFSARHARALATAKWEEAGLQPIGFHEARHTFASIMIAAGLNIKVVQEWMGHASITTTLDTYGHLLPGAGVEAQQRIDAYLA